MATTDARFDLGFEVGQLALDAAVFLLGEVILGVFRQITKGGGFADSLLHIDLGGTEQFLAASAPATAISSKRTRSA